MCVGVRGSRLYNCWLAAEFRLQTLSIEKLMLIMWATFSNSNQFVIVSVQQVVNLLQQEMTYSVLFTAPVVSTVFITNYAEE